MITALALVTIFLGSVMKGAIGMGLPLLAIPLLTIALDVPTAIAIVAVPIIVTNTLQVAQFRRALLAQRYMLPFLVAGAVGTFIGTQVLVSAPVELLQVALGVAVLVYLASQLALPALTLPLSRASFFAGPFGFVTGLLQGAVGISSPVSVTFLQSLRVDREGFVSAISAVFLLFSMVQVSVLIADGTLTLERAGIGALTLLAVAAGMPLGDRLGRRLSADIFRRVIFVALAGIAVLLIANGLG
ncbi:sulfite exporter TauE/SafE family protein [Acuticoccus sp.]|uniref:sulfite exporter TauE/SafE family protein n=1 Tax=Acuticoccus sp. TaxID=1904378 RepID=UPI003B5199C9